jgi:hypothetical protein
MKSAFTLAGLVFGLSLFGKMVMLEDMKEVKEEIVKVFTRIHTSLQRNAETKRRLEEKRDELLGMEEKTEDPLTSVSLLKRIALIEDSITCAEIATCKELIDEGRKARIIIREEVFGTAEPFSLSMKDEETRKILMEAEKERARADSVKKSVKRASFSDEELKQELLNTYAEVEATLRDCINNLKEEASETSLSRVYAYFGKLDAQLEKWLALLTIRQLQATMTNVTAKATGKGFEVAEIILELKDAYEDLQKSISASVEDLEASAEEIRKDHKKRRKRLIKKLGDVIKKI